MKKILITLMALTAFINIANAVESTNKHNNDETISGGGGAFPVGLGFNYQGELIENGQIVNTPRVFTFSLYDSSIGGTQLGPTLEYGSTIFPVDEPGYPITNGLFFMEDMNFGDQYDGTRVWLEITVRTPDLQNCGVPNPPCSIAEVLSPRQVIKAVPYAVQADYLGPIGATNGDILQFDGDEWLPESPPSQFWGIVGVGGGTNYIYFSGGDIHVQNGGATIGSGNVSPTNGLDVTGLTKLHNRTAIGFDPGSIEPALNFESLSVKSGIFNQALRLYGNEANLVGSRLHFGNSDTVFIGEDQNDILLIHATQGVVVDNKLTVQAETKLEDDVLISGHIGINTGSTASNIIQAAVHIQSTSIEGRALFASSTSGQYTPDIILGGTGSGNTQDEGVISSDTRYAGSDLWLMSNDAVVIRLDQDNNENGDFEIRNGADSVVFEVSETGVVRQNGSTIHASDRRLKKNIENLYYGLAEIMVLKPKAYNWKSHQQKSKSFGLIAQDVQKIMPELVDVSEDKDRTLGLSYTELIPVLINAIQEQQIMIEALNEKIDRQNLIK